MGFFENELMQQMAFEERQRLERFAAAWAAYYGRGPKPLRIKAGKPDDNVQVNYLRMTINKGVTALVGKGMKWDYGADEKAQAYLDAIWKGSRRSRTLKTCVLNGAVCGHTFVKIAPQAAGMPRIIVLDPATVTAYWKKDDLNDVYKYRIQWNDVDGTGRPIIRRQTIEQVSESESEWLITDAESRPDSTVWTTTATTRWPYAFAPIIDCQNLPAPNEFWGLSDIEADVIGLQKSIDFMLSNLQRIIRYHAHPKTWGKGFNANELKIAADETIVLPNAGAELHNLEMTSDLRSSIELYVRMKEALHAIVQVPEVATGKLDTTGPLSGVALEVLYQPLVDITDAKREEYGELFLELNRRLLVLANMEPSPGTLIWPDVIPKDAKAERETAVLDKELGVSEDTILQGLGYDPDAERAKRVVDSSSAADNLLTAMTRRP
ncbi:Portal protein [uncultured Caudovirales phage]|uniref:Portal protein n=1 Tax=uncultured Caudovirales phage TaxID=2100421 RepID=A0A6J5MRM8_9CAUD|nr:Portal protein [uncultured Caudovirales phage]